MKIEKISDTQIRCTLTREDLANRQIRLSELAYGSSKAKELFRDMMQQAIKDYGFKMDDTPLMIEAIPMSPDTLVLIITKVEDPEELDSRFSRFSPDESGSYETPAVPDLLSGADDVLDLISKLASARKQAAQEKKAAGASGAKTPSGRSLTAVPTEQENAAPGSDADTAADSEDLYNFTEFFLFHDLESLIRAAHIIVSDCSGPSSLFRSPDDDGYFLILKKGSTPSSQFNKICNVLSEYAVQADYTAGMEAYFTEHLRVIAAGDALQKLSQI